MTVRKIRRARPLTELVAVGLAIGMASPGCSRSAAPSAAAASNAPPASTVLTPPPLPPPDAASATAIRDASDRLAASTPKSAFDVDRKAAELGADVNRLFAYVRDDVRDEIYAGVLRGARGTLIAHAANSWDKAVLLAALLRTQGREVRFVRGRLAPDREAALVAKMFDEVRRPQPAPSAPQDAAAAQGSRLVERIESRWRAARADLTAALDRGGVTLGRTAPVPDALLADEAADHAWVEYRDGDRWIPLDPSAAAQPGEAVASASETFAEIPAALQHRITIRVKVEERRNQALAEREAFVWPTTAAALHGARLVLAHRIDRTPLGRWRATPALFVDDQVYGALSYTDAGLETSASAPDALVGDASRQVQGVGAISDLFGAPASSAPAAPRNGGELSAVRLEVEFAGPAGRTEVVRRDMLDRIGPAARAAKTEATAPLSPLTMASGVPLELLTIYGCAVTAGSLDPRAVSARVGPSVAVIEDSLALRKMSQAGGTPAPADVQARLARIARSLPDVLAATAQTLHVLSQTLARRIEPAGSAILWYEATPRLAIVSLDPRSSTPTIDLRRDPLRVVARGVPAENIVRANLARGVLDGVIEDTLVETALAGSPKLVSISTVAVLERAREQNIRVVATTRRGDDGSQQVVVAPERAPAINAASRLAWWQVDAATGETIGVLDNGLHGAQAIPEYGSRAQAISPLARTIGGAASAEQGYAAGFAAGEASGYGAGVGWGMVAGTLIGAVMAVVAFVVAVLVAEYITK